MHPYLNRPQLHLQLLTALPLHQILSSLHSWVLLSPRFPLFLRLLPINLYMTLIHQAPLRVHIQYSLLCIIFETELTLLAGNSQTNTSGRGSLLSFRPLGLVTLTYHKHLTCKRVQISPSPSLIKHPCPSQRHSQLSHSSARTHHQIFTRCCTDSISLIAFQPISSSQVLLKLPEFRLTLLLEGLQHPPPPPISLLPISPHRDQST